MERAETDDFAVTILDKRLHTLEKIVSKLSAPQSNGVFDVTTGKARVAGNIIPDTNNARNLGAASLVWDNIYANNITASNITGSIIGGSTASNTWLINSGFNDLNIDLIWGRTTGGSATMRWNGILVTLDKPLTVAGVLTGTQLISTVAIGTAPLQVTSTTKVNNLNADTTDGVHFSGSGFTLTIPETGTAVLTTRTITAGAGLTGGGNLSADRTIAVGAGDGITVNATSVALTTPGTLDVNSINDASTNHKHAITSSSNPGANARILASNSNGYLRLVRLGIGIDPSYPLHVLGNAWVDGDLTFVGAQSIFTTADSLTISPAADLNLTPGGTARVRTTSGVAIQSDNFASQTTGWRIRYNGAADFRYIYTDELHAKAFIADLEQALAGGQIIAKSVAPLFEDFTNPAAGGTRTLTVECFLGFPNAEVFQTGDTVMVRNFSRSGGGLTITNSFGIVTNPTVYSTADPPYQTWTFTRLSGAVNGHPAAGYMSASEVVKRGALVLDFGVSGNGYHEVNAIDGQMAENSPYAQVVNWNAHPWYDRTVRTRTGNLKGIFNVADEFGLYAGDGTIYTGNMDASQYLRISNKGIETHNVGIKMYDGASVTLQMTPTIPSIQMGNTLPTYDNGTGFFAGKDGVSAYKFFLGNSNGDKITWNGSTLNIVGSLVVGGGVGFTTSAVLYLPFDGPLPYETNMIVNTSGHLGLVPTITGSVIGKKGKFGKAVQAGEAVTNHITNPSFEVNVTNGWTISSSDGTATRTRASAQSKFGSYSMLLVRNTATWCFARANDITLANGESCTVSTHFYRGQAGGTEANLALYNVSTLLVSKNTTSASYRNWEKVVIGYTNNTGATVTLHARIVFSNVVGNVNIDGVQFTKTAYPQAYVDGSLGDAYIWSGTAHNSTSSWAGGSLDYLIPQPSLSKDGSLVFWFAPALDLNGTYQNQGYNDLVRLLFADTENAGSMWLRWDNDGKANLRITDSAGNYGNINVDLYDSVWVHVGYSWDLETGKSAIYLNGVEIASSTTFPGFTYGTMTQPLLTLFQSAKSTIWIDDLAITDHALTADEMKAIYKSNAPLNISTNKFELMLVGTGTGKVWGHAGGLFAVDNAGNASFALSNANSQVWSGTTIDSGDIVLGKIATGSANIFWDQSTGKFQFRENTTTQVEIGADGALYAGGGNVRLNSDGFAFLSQAAFSTQSSISWINSGYTLGKIEHYTLTPVGGGNKYGMMSINLYDQTGAYSGNIAMNSGGVSMLGELEVGGRINMTSTTQGFVPSRVTTTQRNAFVSPARGTIVFDTTASQLYVYRVGIGGEGWYKVSED